MGLKKMLAGLAMSASLFAAGAAHATDIEVTHWWTSGGEAAAVHREDDHRRDVEADEPHPQPPSQQRSGPQRSVDSVDRSFEAAVGSGYTP